MTTTEPEPPETRGSSDWAPGTVLHGRFRIEAQIGRGGMGAVYRARDQQMLRPVAIKVCNANPAGAAAEATILAQIEHRNVVRVYEFVASKPCEPALLVMEFAPGRSLDRFLIEQRTRSGGCPQDMFFRLARQIASGLAACHRKGVTHRDLKPQNIIVDGDGTAVDAKLCDFGIASLRRRDHVEPSTLKVSPVEAGEVWGSRLYMAPEQWDHGNPGPTSDVYALGCVFHEMLTGAPPFPDTPGIADLHRRGPRPRPSRQTRWVGAALDRMIAKMTAVEPSERFPDAAHVLPALETAHAGGIARLRIYRRSLTGALAGGYAAFYLSMGESAPALQWASDVREAGVYPTHVVIPFVEPASEGAMEAILEPERSSTPQPARRTVRRSARNAGQPLEQNQVESAMRDAQKEVGKSLTKKQIAIILFSGGQPRAGERGSNLRPSDWEYLLPRLKSLATALEGKTLACKGKDCEWR